MLLTSTASRNGSPAGMPMTVPPAASSPALSAQYARCANSKLVEANAMPIASSMTWPPDP